MGEWRCQATLPCLGTIWEWQQASRPKRFDPGIKSRYPLDRSVACPRTSMESRIVKPAERAVVKERDQVFSMFHAYKYVTQH
jgi:hypothetical protein